MSGRPRVHLARLLLVAVTSMGLGVCATLLSASPGMACCDRGDGHAAFTVCCSMGEQSSSDVPSAVYAAPAAESAFVVLSRGTVDRSAHLQALRRVPFRVVDPQALLSTFLI
jgi:hypothetical protein